ncbi:hypothetical protein ACQKIC_16380 [Peribacillus sp. NPDC046944]|uniref:hypothetical protein n=1 Tax=unclassified Peribacillus TaxID=2675266 RepID=UPI003CFD3356
MKTLKVVDGDFVFDAAGNLEWVKGDEEIVQGVKMNLSVRKGEFELDEWIGLDQSFLGERSPNEEEVIDNILEALQVMTDQGIIEGAEDINVTNQNGEMDLSLRILKTDGTEINLEGSDFGGSE